MTINRYKQLWPSVTFMLVMAISAFQIGCGGVGSEQTSDSAEVPKSAELAAELDDSQDALATPGFTSGSEQEKSEVPFETEAFSDEVADADVKLKPDPAMMFRSEVGGAREEKASAEDRSQSFGNSSGPDSPGAGAGAGGFGGGGGGTSTLNGRGSGFFGESETAIPSTKKSTRRLPLADSTKPALESSEQGGQPPVTRGRRRFALESNFQTVEEKIVEAKKAQQRSAQLVTLQPGEELWVIAQSADTTAPSEKDPGSGCLMALLPGQKKHVPIPLKHTSVVGNIDGYIASVNVTQQFHNPYDSKIEASYVFPLPQNAAVNEFVMTVGDRKIRGIIREKEKAKQIYEAAKAQGHVASLMTQQRPNIFTQKVANIEPGKQIDIDIRYFNTLRYDDGAYEFVFPMVVGPRFNPSPGDGIGAVARGDHGTSGQATEVQYLAPNERSGHDVDVTVNINAGIKIEDINCINHAVETEKLSPCYRTVTLAKNDRIPNKDFVLRYQIASDQIKTAMLTHEDDNGQYFTMMVYPPKSLADVRRSPMEMVFVLDCSGSMRGAPMKQAKAAIRHALLSLTDRDTFQIIRFSNNASQLGSEPVLATAENVERGLQYLNGLSGTGGTQMIEGIKAALDFPHDEGRFRLVSFMTDGYIGNEQQILSTLHQKLGSARIFSFGVGSSPNRFLMDRMASLGKGAVAYLSLNGDAVKVVNRFNDQISHPAMTDLTIDWGNMNVTDVYPSRLPDLIVGRPVVLTGRFTGEPGTVKINGRVDMEPASFDVAIDEQEGQKPHQGIAAVWARLKIKDLMLQKAEVPAAAEAIENAVTQTALAYNLMSKFTSFVAVDSMTKTDGKFGTTVAVPVSVPDGVRYDTTVGGQGSEDR